MSDIGVEIADSSKIDESVPRKGPPTVSRRAVLTTFGKAAVAVSAVPAFAEKLMTATPAQAAEIKHDLLGDNPQREYDWTTLRQLLEERISQEADLTIKTRELDLLNRLDSIEAIFEYRARRLNRFRELIYQDVDKNGVPVVIGYFRNLRGKMTAKPDDEIVPVLHEKKILDDRFDQIRKAVAGHKTNAEYVDYAHQLLTNHGRSEGDRIPNKETRPLMGRLQVSVSKDDIEIVPGSEGEKEAQKDINRITQYIQRTIPDLQNIFTNLFLFSARYGKVKRDRPGYSGYFTPYNFGPASETFVNMDHSAGYGSYWNEVVFGHEVAGHNSDVLHRNLNYKLVDQLSVEDAYARMRFMVEILQNPHFGVHDGSLRELMEKAPVSRGDSSFINDVEQMTSREFKGIINEYPRQFLYDGGFVGDIKSFIDDAFTPQARQDNWTRTNDWPITVVDNAITYKNVMDFADAYRNQIEASAKAGNIKAKVIDWAIKQYGDSLSPHKGMWNYRYKGDYLIPGVNLDAKTWTNYMTVVVANTAVYDAFINGRKEITDLFTEKERDSIQDRIEEARSKSRAEVWAEGVGFSHFIGYRFKPGDEPPYRKGLEQIAEMLRRN